METYSASDACIHLSELINRIACDNKPICVQGDNSNVVIITEEEYSSIRETLYLMSIPGMVDSILKADEEKLEDCLTELSW